jgi:hypothetical protein
MNSEQRRFPRKRPEQLVYIELGPQNGGMMLSVSEEGFSFRAVSPVLTKGTIHFAFAIDAKRRIEGDCELAWTDETGNVAGLRFVELSPEYREQLHAWLTEKKTPAVAGTEVVPAAATPADTLETLRREIREVPVRVALAGATAKSRAGVVQGPPVAEKKERFPASEKEEPPAIKWEEEAAAEKEPPTHLSLGWAVVGMLFVLVVVLLAVGRRTVGESLILVGEQIAGETKPSDTTPAEQPVATPKPVAGKGAAAEPVRTKASVRALPDAGGNGIVRGAVPSATSADAGPMAPATEQPGERGKEDLSASADPVQLLWAAVRKGNTAAQVALAGFYLRGEGVAKNCSQARVLLAAAAKKGNAEAKQKLAQLEQEGCP